ncbi:hypothetical protein KCU59_g169, partial [Aureobasidium melanogenum]
MNAMLSISITLCNDSHSDRHPLHTLEGRSNNTENCMKSNACLGNQSDRVKSRHYPSGPQTASADHLRRKSSQCHEASCMDRPGDRFVPRSYILRPMCFATSVTDDQNRNLGRDQRFPNLFGREAINSIRSAISAHRRHSLFAKVRSRTGVHEIGLSCRTSWTGGLEGDNSSCDITSGEGDRFDVLMIADRSMLQGRSSRVSMETQRTKVVQEWCRQSRIVLVVSSKLVRCWVRGDCLVAHGSTALSTQARNGLFGFCELFAKSFNLPSLSFTQLCLANWSVDACDAISDRACFVSKGSHDPSASCCAEAYFRAR